MIRLIIISQTKMNESVVCCMEINPSNTLLFTGDDYGFVYIWNIETYGLHKKETDSAECMIWEIIIYIFIIIILLYYYYIIIINYYY